VAAYVNGIVRDEGRAEDVTQEAFLSALRRLRETDREIVFKPWIFQIARNASIDLYRRGRRTEEVPIDADGSLPAADTERLAGPAGPDSSLIDKERFDHLAGALAELSESHHRIIVLRELEGLSYREIGERMELSPAGVESTLFRARRKLEHEYLQIDTGRRCESVGALIGRLAEGLESARDRRRLDRHARRCATCRRRARELGVEPVLPRRRPISRIAALLPLPTMLKRREVIDLHQHGIGAGIQQAAPLQGVSGPALESTVTAGKAVAAMAAAALIGGGGATLGGAGPLGDAVRGPAPVTPAHTASPSPKTLFLDGAMGRPFPAPAQVKQRSPSPPPRSAPDSRPSVPTGVGGGVPVNPLGQAPTRVPSPPSASVPSPGASAPRGQIRLPSPSQGAAGGAAVSKPLAEPLKAIDVKQVLGRTADTVAQVLAPPSR
jgi:RNA polymerase sigma factor (sigma-70 family)